MRSIFLCFICPIWGQEEIVEATQELTQSEPILGSSTRSLCLEKCQFKGRLCDGLKKKERNRCETESQNSILTCQNKCNAPFKDCHFEKSQCEYQCKFLAGTEEAFIHKNCEQSCHVEFQCCNLNIGLEVMEPPFWATSRYCDLGCELDLTFCKDNCNGINQIPSSKLGNVDCTADCEKRQDVCQNRCTNIFENGMCYNDYNQCQQTNGLNCQARALCCMSDFLMPQNPTVPEQSTSSPTTTTITTSIDSSEHTSSDQTSAPPASTEAIKVKKTKAPKIHKETHAPKETEAPETPKETKAPKTHKETKAPETPKTHTPKTHKETKAPEIPKETKAPKTPEETKAPETPKTHAPETHKETKAPETPKTHAPKTPEETKAPETPEETHAPKTHKETKAPETHKETKAPETPKETHAPKTKETKAPETPKETHAPKAKETKAPETPKETHAPKTHKETHAPKTTEASDAVRPSNILKNLMVIHEGPTTAQTATPSTGESSQPTTETETTTLYNFDYSSDTEPSENEPWHKYKSKPNTAINDSAPDITINLKQAFSFLSF